MKFLIILFVLLFSVNAYAGQVTQLICDPPILNEDGTTVDDLAGFIFYCGPETIAKPTCNALLGEFITVDGLHNCHVTSVDFSGNESQPSNSVGVTRQNGNFYGKDGVSPGSPILSLE